MRRFLTGLLCLSMLSSLFAPAFASNNMQGSTGVTITVEGQDDSNKGSSGGGGTNGSDGGSTETGKGEQSGGSGGRGNGYFLNRGISMEEDMKLYGYMIGMPGYVFGEDYNLIRAEYATIINRMSVFEGEEEVTKSSLDIKGHWAEAQINRLASQGVVCGVSVTHFRPDGPITRGQVLLMLSHVLYTTNFSTDDKAVDLSDHYAKKQIIQMLNSGIVPTYDSSCDLSQYITRGRMYVITNNMICPRNSIDTVRMDLYRQKDLLVDLLSESEELFYTSSLHTFDINFLKKAEVKR